MYRSTCVQGFTAQTGRYGSCLKELTSQFRINEPTTNLIKPESLKVTRFWAQLALGGKIFFDGAESGSGGNSVESTSGSVSIADQHSNGTL